ncbi:hypothetical protein ACLOJK_032224 [Asimina triloba]
MLERLREREGGSCAVFPNKCPFQQLQIPPRRKMQSSYGVPEMQQFMVDGSFSSLLQHQQQPQQPRFHHLQSIPITQQFFQQQQHPQFFHAFQQQQQQQRRLHQQLGLDIESAPESPNSQPRIIGGGGLAFLAGNFKLAAANEDSGGRREVLNEDDPIVVVGGGGGEDASDSQTTAVAFHPWQQQQQPQREEESTKEPFWKPLAVEYVNRNNKRCKEKLETSSKFSKKSDGCKEHEEGNTSGSNYGLFGELEAIYAHGGGVGAGGGGNNQTGSGSALTGDNNPPAAAVVQGPTGVPSSGIDHGSETSNGEEASLKKQQKRGRRKKKKMWSHVGSIANFFESLVKQLMNHQEGLHRKFLEVMEKKDQERTEREQAWRQQEAEKSNREANARTQERAISASREAAIISFLEKITGESVNLPNTPQFQFSSDQFQEEPAKEDKPIEQPSVLPNHSSTQKMISFTNSRRWPKAEVQALIRVRSGLESKFQEPGLKGPLWEEVSSSMASMGYQRSAKRCKEKWENINKYFRKTKDTAKKRSQHSKTCPYFHQLHQLYSKTSSHSSTLPTAIEGELQQRKDNSELLDAIVIAPPNADQVNDQNPSLQFIQKQMEEMNQSYKLTQMMSMRLDNIKSDIANEGSSGKAGKEIFGNEEDYEEDDGDDDDDGGSDGDDDNDDVEGEGENQEHVQNQGIAMGGKHGEEEKHHQKPMFFCLES